MKETSSEKEIRELRLSLECALAREIKLTREREAVADFKRQVDAMRPVIDAAKRWFRCLTEFDGEQEYCGEYSQAFFDALDKYEKGES